MCSCHVCTCSAYNHCCSSILAKFYYVAMLACTIRTDGAPCYCRQSVVKSMLKIKAMKSAHARHWPFSNKMS